MQVAEGPDDGRVLWTVRETAKAMGISLRTLWALTRPRGDLSCVRVGARVLYRPESVREWAAGRESTSA